MTPEEFEALVAGIDPPLDLGWRRPRWMGRGSCVGKPGELWFGTDPHDTARARSWCARCVVSTDCLDHATAHDELGIWAGLDQRERRRLKRQRRVA